MQKLATTKASENGLYYRINKNMWKTAFLVAFCISQIQGKQTMFLILKVKSIIVPIFLCYLYYTGQAIYTG